MVGEDQRMGAPEAAFGLPLRPTFVFRRLLRAGLYSTG